MTFIHQRGRILVVKLICGSLQEQNEICFKKAILWFLKKLQNFDSAIPLLGMYLKELKAGTQTDICMPVFIATLSTVAERS